MQPVGQLDDDHPDILGHGQQHFTHILRLLFRTAGIGNVGKLGHAVYKVRHIAAKLFLDILQRNGSVLHHIVQNAADDGIGIHSQANQDNRNLDRMRDIGIPGRTHLSLVGLPGHRICGFNTFQIVAFIGFFNSIGQFCIQRIHSLTYPI